MATYKYPVTILPTSAFSIISTEIPYTLTINYESPVQYSFSLQPVKSATSYLLTQNITLTYQSKEIWHIDASAARDTELSILKTLDVFGTQHIEPEHLVAIYLSEKTDGLVLRFQSRLDKDAAMKWLQLEELDVEKRMLFRQRVDVRDRFFGLRTFKNCFVASDAIRVLMSIWKCSRQNAVWLGRRMQQQYKMFYHVANEHLFKDRFLFFRLSDNSEQFVETTGFLGSIYGGVMGFIDSTTRNVARYTGTDDVLDFASQIGEDAKSYALETNKIIEEILYETPKETKKDIPEEMSAVMTPTLAQILTQKWDSSNIKDAMHRRAIEDVRHLFPYPDSLKQVPMLIKTYSEMSNALENQSLSAMKIQIKQAQSSRELLSRAQLYIKQNHTSFDIIQETVSDPSDRIPSFEQVKQIQQVLANVRLTREWLQRIEDVRSEYVKLQIVIQEEFAVLSLDYTEELDEDELQAAMQDEDSNMDLLEVHLRIRSLSEFKLKALHDLKAEISLLSQFESYFSIIDTVNRQLQQIITKHSQNIIYYAAEGQQEKVIQILRIIEREEQYENELRQNVTDEQLLQNYEWRNYRKLFFDSIQSSVRSMIRKETANKPLTEKLNYLAESIEDLLYVKQYTRGLFPRHYNIMQFYVKTYESEILHFIEKRTNNLKKLSNADNSAIVAFLQEYEDYFDDSVLKYVDQLHDYGPLIEQLNAQFVNNCSAKLLDFSDNILKIVFGEDMEPVEIEGSKFSTGPFDLLKTIQAQLEQARQRAVVAAPLIQQARQVFKYYCSKFESRVTKTLETISVYELCLYINDYDLLNQFREEIGWICRDILLEVATTDEKLAKELEAQRENIVETWIAGEAALQNSRQTFMTELVKIIGEELAKIPKAITSTDVKELTAVLRDLRDFSTDMKDVFSEARFHHSMGKIDAQVAELFIEGLIVREPEITEKVLQLLTVSAQLLKEVFSALEQSQSHNMVHLVNEFLTRFQDGFEAAETTQNLLYEFPDIEKEVFASLLKHSKHISQARKKEMTEYIVPFFGPSRFVARRTIFKDKYPKSMKPAPSKVKIDAANATQLQSATFMDMIMGTPKKTDTKKAENGSAVPSTPSNGKTTSTAPASKSKEKAPSTADDDIGADVVNLSDLLGEEVKLPNLSSLLQQSNNYASDSDTSSEDDE